MMEQRSEKYELVKGYYDRGLWNLDRVWMAVGRWITAEEYKLITGFNYPDKE